MSQQKQQPQQQQQKQQPQQQQQVALGDKLEEGRIALYQLEKHLKDSQRHNDKDDTVSVGSRQQSLRSERSMLDQVSRESRMHYRKDSPLGLTVEELDDRGLLDGGSVPKYYASMRQRGRRPLELRKRDARIQDRDRDPAGNTSRSFEVFFHMIRTMAKRGVRIEEYCRQYDTSGSGMVERKRFLTMVRNMGLPLSQKDVLDIAQCYTVRGTDMVDFEGLLRDSRVLDLDFEQEDFIQNDNQLDPKEGESNNQRFCTGVLPDVKRMLIDSVRSLGKSLEDVYQMFARWDNQGAGTVTATQFLRVLARLHVHLSDDDQDFLVELLDANAQGRVNFESLLSFCFNDKGGETQNLSSDNGIAERQRDGGGIAEVEGDGDDAGDGGETVSAVSIEGLHEQKSISSSGNNERNFNRRPHTASHQRRKSRDSMSGASHGDGSHDDGETSKPQRPLTASARVNQQQDWDSPDKIRHGNGGKDLLEDDGVALDIEGEADFVDDVHGVDAGSFNDNTLATSQDDFGSPGGVAHYDPNTVQRVHNRRDLWNAQSMEFTASQEGLQIGDPESLYTGTNMHFPIVPPSESATDVVPGEPTEHLRLVADQTLRTVRELILSRKKTGRNLREIFRHFDRSDSGYFDTEAFLIACRELNVEIPLEVSRLCIESIGIDNQNKVSFGEFCVFVQDLEHSVLESTVQSQLARQLELQGRHYNDILYTVFSDEETRQSGAQQAQSGFVSKEAFARALVRTGLHLSKSDQRRLVTRFDVHGEGYCSVERFLRMIQTSTEWKKAVINLNTLEDARREAAELLKELTNGRSQTSTGLSKEVISMAEYLGIRPISEPGLLWIAADALNAPLPVSWTAQSDSAGRTFFYNHVTRESSWDHPLDPYFRNLRDKYRREGGDSVAGSGSPSRSIHSPQHKPLNQNLASGVGPSPHMLMSGNQNIRQNRHTDDSHIQKTRRRPQSAQALPSVSNRPGESYAHTKAVVHAAIEKQERLYLPPSDPDWAMAPSKWKGKNENRPVSAPSAARKKAHMKKSQAIYNSEYFNLSHYKQGGYNVEAIEAANKALNTGMLGQHQPRQRAASAGVRRKSRNISGGRQPRMTHQEIPSSTTAAAASFHNYGELAKQNPGANFDKGSVVDRAIYGTPVPMYLQPRLKSERFVPQQNSSTGVIDVDTILQGNYRQNDATVDEKLSEMYDDNVLNRLDQVVRPSVSVTAPTAPPSRSSAADKKKNSRGGIVII